MEKTREQLEERKVKGIQKFGGRNLMIWDCVEWNEVGMQSSTSLFWGSVCFEACRSQRLMKKTLSFYKIITPN
jgi:hypothetical protein